MTACVGLDDTGSLWRLVHSCGGGPRVGLQNQRPLPPNFCRGCLVCFVFNLSEALCCPPLQSLCFPATCRPCCCLETGLSPWVWLTNGRELGYRGSRLSVGESGGREGCQLNHLGFWTPELKGTLAFLVEGLVSSAR